MTALAPLVRDIRNRDRLPLLRDDSFFALVTADSFGVSWFPKGSGNYVGHLVLEMANASGTDFFPNPFHIWW